ncbi:MAG: hypothetical protein ACPHF3_13745 [Pseudomonadales bacterium]
MFRLVVVVIAILFGSATDAENSNYVGLVDPTMPLQLSLEGVAKERLGERVTEVVIEQKTYTVSSILVRPDAKFALINQQRVSEGDAIDGAVVASIDREGVTLQRGIESIRLSLYKQSIKKPRL